MSFKGKDFSPEMIQFVVGLRNHFTIEKKTGATVSTKNPTLRTAEGLGIGEATVKRIMARYNRDDQKIIIPQSRPRGKPVHQVEKKSATGYS